MKPYLILASLLAALTLSACTEDETYPVSGEECGPNDPVKDLDAADCLPPVGNI